MNVQTKLPNATRWNGGPCPFRHPLDTVSVLHRDGDVTTGRAVDYPWNHRDNPLDIVAYVVVSGPSTLN